MQATGEASGARHDPPLCPICGRAAKAGKLVCAGCGTRIDVFSECGAQRDAPAKRISAVAIGLCCVGLLGVAGLHRFYLGRKGSAVLMLLTLGGFFIWTLVDLHRLWENDLPDKHGLPLREGYER